MPIHLQRTFDLPDTAVGGVLWAARVRTNLDLRSAADAGGIDWRVLSRIERGERPCRVTELVSLSEPYGVAPDFLMRAIMGDEKARKRLGIVDEDEAEGAVGE